MSDLSTDEISIRKIGRAGRITLTRPKALNALSYEMCMATEAALDLWADDDDVKMVVMDAEGDKAFSAGGDIDVMYRTGKQGDFAYGQKFWRDEYRMDAKLFEFSKPVAPFMQGFTMGGGVGISCHGSHRVVGESSRIAMPECGIGLVPDVGGSLILARAPGRLGEYLGTTGTRMGPGDAIHVGFADFYIPEADWPALIARLEDTGDWEEIDRAAHAVPESPLAAQQAQIDASFGGETLRDIVNALNATDSEFAAGALKALNRNSPLSVACTIELIHRSRANDTIRGALTQEYRFTARSMEHGDFIEGIRAQIIDKDRNPNWKHENIDAVTSMDVAQMLMPLGKDELVWED